MNWVSSMFGSGGWTGRVEAGHQSRGLALFAVVVAATGACGGGTEGSEQASLRSPEPEPASTQLTGCYDVTEGGWVVEEAVPGRSPAPVPSESGGDTAAYQIPPRITFGGPSDRWPGKTEVVVPEGALPTPHRWMTGEIAGDSLTLIFSNGYYGVVATLTRSVEGWTGTSRTLSDVIPHQVNARPVELTPVPCDSPPPVSIEVMPVMPRTVELEGGQAITLGQPLPELVERVVLPRDTFETAGVVFLAERKARVLGRTRGLFGATDSIHVVLTDDGVVHTVRLAYHGPDDHASLQARLHAPDGLPEAVLSASLAGNVFTNRITGLSIRTWRPDRAEVRLYDRRLGG